MHCFKLVGSLQIGVLIRVLMLTLMGFFLVVAPPAEALVQAPQWSYSGAANPTHWGQLNDDFVLCERGQQQSPINLDQAMADAPAILAVHDASAPWEILNRGYTIQVNAAPGNTIQIAGKASELVQFHFHIPSEHRIAGSQAEMELHLVHRDPTGTLAVVSVLIEAGANNPAIAPLWEHIPDVGKTYLLAPNTIHLSDLLPSHFAFYSYAGSLTTPPCYEGVEWTVLAEPIHLSKNQIATFASLFPMNSRPLQPTNGRTIGYHSAS